MNKAAININFDSLNEAYDFPTGFTDPCFSSVAQRFFAIADKFRFKYSIYLVGKDLEHPAHREAVREWSRRGHEIGNHSWSHHMNLGALSPDEIYDEIARSHELIAEAAGVEPKGFISPAWSDSAALKSALIRLGYEYDTSNFSSWLLSPMVLRIAWGYRGSPKARRILHRRDYLSSLVGPSSPYIFKRPEGRLAVLPLPMTPTRFPCWHTIGYMFGWPLHARVLRSALRATNSFYYLTHPGDLISTSELSSEHGHRLARIDVPLEEKIARFEESISIILQSGRQLVTVRELAQDVFRKSEDVGAEPVRIRAASN